MNKIGVLYFCEDELKKEFIETKKNFQSKSTKSKYLNHPAHISIYVFEPKIDNYSNLIDDFKMMEKIIDKIYVEMDKWIVFEKDFLTNLNTLCLDIKKIKSLYNFQKKIADLLNKYAKKSTDIKLIDVFLKSQKKYGYPFIGEHWIPHISVGSMNLPKKKLLELSYNHINSKNLIIDKIGLYEIIDDEHVLIETINLK